MKLSSFTKERDVSWCGLAALSRPICGVRGRVRALKAATCRRTPKCSARRSVCHSFTRNSVLAPILIAGLALFPRIAITAEDTGEKYTNRLIHEKSPYLLQHAHNPVDWYPWGKDAFEKAKKDNKPIFLSVGYSTCHWYHVMERESFENPEIAKLMNDNFVSIKVDREERPDID
jgi:hypothetical protein